MTKSSDHSKFLSSIQPFKALNKEDISNIVSSLQEKSFSKGETIFNEGEQADSVWVLFQGRVQILKYTSEGKTFAIESLTKGELFGTLCRIGGDGRSYPCTAVAATQTTALKIADKTFLEYYEKSAGLVRGVCSLCSERLKDVQDLRCMGQETVPIRIASILNRLHQVHGKELPFTKKEIAELSGTTIETTFRTLSDLESNNIVDSKRGKILIHKPEELKKISDKA